MEHAGHPVGPQKPAGGNHLGIEGKLSLALHLAEIGAFPGPNQGLETLFPGGAHDLDLEVPATGRAPLVVGGPAGGGRTGIGLLKYREAPGPGWGRGELSGGEPTPLHDAEAVAAQLPGGGDSFWRSRGPALEPMGGTVRESGSIPEESAGDQELGRDVEVVVVLPEVGEEADPVGVTQEPGRFVVPGPGSVVQCGNPEQDPE